MKERRMTGTSIVRTTVQAMAMTVMAGRRWRVLRRARKWKRVRGVMRERQRTSNSTVRVEMVVGVWCRRSGRIGKEWGVKRDKTETNEEVQEDEEGEEKENWNGRKGGNSAGSGRCV
jgi:hypothetical protein